MLKMFTLTHKDNYFTTIYISQHLLYLSSQHLLYQSSLHLIYLSLQKNL